MTSGGSQSLTVYVYATTVPVDANKTVQSITLPDVSNTTSGGATSMHIWSVYAAWASAWLIHVAYMEA
jgi:hypothetical protein